MNNDLRFTIYDLRKASLSCLCILFSVFSFSQVVVEIDTSKIRIGEQISYKINVEADSTDLVVFPEGQTFMPLEMVETFEIDTTKREAKLLLSKLYKLTQFDSGSYTIPRQKLIVADTPVFTDSLKIEVNTIKVDTTKQKLYDIKPIIEVEKSSSNWWKYLLIIVLCIGVVAFLLYWFIWRKKPLTEEEEIALLPPYDRAKLAIQQLEEQHYLQRAEIKEYYSDLTNIIRKYLDEKVYDHALESTTDELITRLQLLKDGNQIPLKKETIANIKSILKRADLVKFAKSSPDITLAEFDKQTIDKELDHVKASLPEPSEEEKLLDQKYKEEQERKKKRKKTIITVAIVVFLLIATFVGFGLKYGFTYVKDTIIGHESKELLEGNWVKSAYGFPPIYIETPKVLKRTEIKLPEGTPENIRASTFVYGALLDEFSILVNNTIFPKPQPQDPSQQQQGGDTNSQPQIDLFQVSEGAIKQIESQGGKDITVKRDQFITPNNAKGLKTFGTLSVGVANTDITFSANYAMLHFTSDNANVLQQIIITWPEDDTYADDVVKRIINSIELISDEQREAEQQQQNAQ